MAFINLPQNSLLDGKSLLKSRVGSALELNVITILRDDETIMAPKPDFILHSGDRLLVEGQLDQLFELHDHNHLVLEKEHLSFEKLFSAFLVCYLQAS